VITGPSLLDDKYPGWYKKIDLEKLDMYSAYNCILGQLYGTFRKGFRDLHLDDDRFNLEELIHMGFFDSTGDEESEWILAIQSRREAI